jgi:hypothetical protein
MYAAVPDPSNEWAMHAPNGSDARRMMPRLRVVTMAVAFLLTLSATACGGDSAGNAAGEASAANVASETPAGDGSAAATVSPRNFSPALFDDESATVDNEWFPLVPGTRYVWEGRAFEDGDRVDRRVVFTVTDLTKVIGGVRAVVGWDRDFNDGKLGESELVFFAQDKYGNVWHLGQYYELYDEEGEFEGGRVWVVGDPEGSRAGIAMKAQPELSTHSYSQGYAPPPYFWDDRSRVYDTGVRTCVPVDCYDNALVVEEFERPIPGAYQLKYYAQGVGNVRVGWRGKNEEEREVMVLKEYFHLSPEALDAARDEALALEHRAYAYARTPPAQQRGEESP